MTQLTINFDSAQSARDDAIARVDQRAEREDTWDTHAVGEWIVAYLRRHGPCGSEVLTMRAKAAGHVPHDDRAFGSVYMRLAREGRIEKEGLQGPRSRGHAACGGYVWRVTE